MTEFENNMKLIYGERGENWLENLPLLQRKLAYEFGLHDLKPFKDLTYNYVMSGWKDDAPIVLKIGVNLSEIEQEYSALKAFAGYGVVDVVDYAPDDGAILITKATPGETLTTLFPDYDQTALEIACKLTTEAHLNSRPSKYQFPLLQDWLSIIDRDWGLISKEDLQVARNLKYDLLNNSKHNPVLLHGDVHYANILSNGNGWAMIDPKGVIGDPMYDITGCLLREPFKQVMEMMDIKSLLKSRIQYVASYAKCEVDIIWAWTFVQTVMSICWSLEDKQDVDHKIKFLKILGELPPLFA